MNLLMTKKQLSRPPMIRSNTVIGGRGQGRQRVKGQHQGQEQALTSAGLKNWEAKRVNCRGGKAPKMFILKMSS